MRALSKDKGCSMKNGKCRDEADKEHMQTFIKENRRD